MDSNIYYEHICITRVYYIYSSNCIIKYICIVSRTLISPIELRIIKTFRGSTVLLLKRPCPCQYNSMPMGLYVYIEDNVKRSASRVITSTQIINSRADFKSYYCIEKSYIPTRISSWRQKTRFLREIRNKQ